MTQSTYESDPPAPVFRWPVRIYYEDTDAGGVVYHANYIRFMERARTEFLRSLGIELSVMEKERGVVFAIHSLAVEFLKPARLDDHLEVTVALAQPVRPASILFVQTIRRDGRVLCTGRMKVVSLSAQHFRPTAIPSFMFDRLAQSGKIVPQL